MTDARRDVSLSVVVRIDRTGNWVDWSTGHRSVPEVLAVAEPLASLPAVAEIRFDRITRTTERLSLHDLALETEELRRAATQPARQPFAEHIARDVALTPGAIPAAPEAVTVDEIAHAIDNATPYPLEIHSEVCRFMAERLLEMLTIGRRPEHAVWQPDEEPPAVCPLPEAAP